MPGPSQPRLPDGAPTGTGRRWVQASAEADASVDQRLGALLGALRKTAGDDLVAVVVGGSLARGEGAVLAAPSGNRLLSDIDLFAIVEADSHTSPAQLDAAARRAIAGDPFLLAPLDLGVIDRQWFGRMGCSLPAFQLGAGHTVLWERDDRWHRPTSPTGAVDVDDALRLLHNRFAEALLYRGRAARATPEPFALFHRWKVWYDAPLAWLAANGRYHPDRDEQCRRLIESAALMSGGAADWLRAGARRCVALRAAILTAPLREEQLLRMESPSPAPGVGESRTDAAELLRWAWPFWRATLARNTTPGASDPVAELARAFDAGAPFAGDLAAAQRWLRRKPVSARLREARRWAPLAPRRLTPWWRHAPAGVGPERMYASVALRFGGVSEWDQPLRGLVRGFSGDWARRTGDDADAWLAELWSGWIMGGARR